MTIGKKEAGHKFLARLGKTRLRPGGKKATEWLFMQGGLKPESSVLEIACNMGTTSIEMAKRFGCQVTGIDMDTGALARAQENIRQQNLSHLVTVQKADASKLPFDDNSFDVVINEAMLTMYVNKAKSHLLKEYLRVLKPGGKLLTHDIMLTQQEGSAEVVERVHQTIHVNTQPISKEGWRQLFAESGFTNITLDNGEMTLLSPKGLLRDEGVFGTLRIIVNALKKENRQPFFNMFNVFRHNRKQLNYIVFCSQKPDSSAPTSA